MSDSFFTDQKSAFTSALRALSSFIDAGPESPNVMKARHVSAVLKIMVSDPGPFDKHCQVNIAWIGKQTAGLLLDIGNKGPISPRLDDLSSIIYRLVVELDLSLRGELLLELRQFKTYTEEHIEEFDGHAQTQIKFAQQGMAVGVVKQLLGTEAIVNLRQIEPFTKQLNDRFNQWEKRLADEEIKASTLSDSLKKYEQAFNFVGLHQGFDELSKVKVAEVAGLKCWTVFFGILAVCPLVLELGLLYFNIDRLDELKWQFAISSFSFISLTVLLLYFFRIVLRRSEACKTQLLQIELRKTLCRFIQSYAGYSATIKKDNPESLTKFENVIFSSLLSNEEKLPATFDGVEQLAQLVKAVKGGA